MKHLFIINPVAGGGRALKLMPEIKRALKDRNEEFIIKITERPEHATDIARQHVVGEKYRVYSVGGDGTLNEVLNGVVNSGSELAVIPCGSGNDFMKSLANINDMHSLIEKTIGGICRPIDIARAGNKYFINITSIGFDAEVAYNTNRLKKIPGIKGSMSYILGVMATIIRCRNNYLRIKIDERQIHQKLLLIAVANGKYYGGGMKVAPDAVIDDGEFSICLISEKGRIEIITLLPRFIKGEHGDIEGVNFLRGRRVEIKSDKDIAINIDGETSMIKDIVLEIIPKGINMVIPE